MSDTAERVVDQLILENKILPEHRDDMILALDEELRKHSRRQLRRLAQRAIEVASSKGLLRVSVGEED